MDYFRETDNAKMLRSWRRIRTFALIVLVGINLRTALLGVPPILPLLSHDLHLSYTETGLLTSLPTLVMGIAALPVGILIGRVRGGGRAMVAFGLVLLTLGAALRAIWPAVVPLYCFTALLSLGSACSQTAIPTLARQWFAKQIGLATALYTDGLVIGETLGAALTIPLMLSWLGRDAWASSFVFWSIPIAITLLLWLWLAPPTYTAEQVAETIPSTPATSARKPAQINPWTLGLLLGGAQLIYFGTNAWVAPYNQAIHASSFTWLALGTLNAAQLPASLAVTLFADKLVGRQTPFVICGVLCLIALAGWIWTPVFLEPLWAALVGGTSIFIYTLGLALPALLAKQEEVAQWTGRMLTVGYLFAFLGPFIGGWLWDITHIPAIAFLPLALAAGVVLMLGLLLPRRGLAVPQSL
ncbi:MAG TPA: MFS transporter [Ktedonobacteraceae bacterium]|nr:MFS transporter [Ktedonobacteraceae bacterium]